MLQKCAEAVNLMQRKAQWRNPGPLGWLAGQARTPRRRERGLLRAFRNVDSRGLASSLVCSSPGTTLSAATTCMQARAISVAALERAPPSGLPPVRSRCTPRDARDDTAVTSQGRRLRTAPNQKPVAR